jgi:outer membrane protein OmpA-like peptidoglycan-associated protein
MSLSRLRFAAIALAALAALPAAAADARGCRDLAGLKRFERSEIVQCDAKAFAEYRLPTSQATGYDFNAKRGVFATQVELEGRLTRNVYVVPSGPSSAEVFRNYRVELAEKGFTVLFEGKQAEVGWLMGKVFENDGPGGQLLGYSPDEARYVAAVKEENGVKTHLSIYVVEYRDGFHNTVRPAKGQVVLRVDMLESGALKQQMVLVSAAEIARGLDQTGKVALYGLNFDFNKATLQPDSRPTLDEIAKFLKDNPRQAIHVVGHTDSVGGLDSNQKLSQARAATVVAELAKSYGIAPARMRPAGLGLLAPVASNATEDGRARNRRVELLPQ